MTTPTVPLLAEDSVSTRRYSVAAHNFDARALRDLLDQVVAERPEDGYRWWSRDLGDQVPPTARVGISATGDGNVVRINLEWTLDDVHRWERALEAAAQQRDRENAAAELANAGVVELTPAGEQAAAEPAS